MIKNYIKNHIFAVIIAVTGFVSSIVTMFVNVADSLNNKYVILIIWILLTVIFLLIGIITRLYGNNSYQEDIKQLKLKSLKKSIGKCEIFKNESNINLTFGDCIKIYFIAKDDIEVFIGLGLINHIQADKRICHIEFLVRNDVITNINNEKIFFSLKINRDELSLLNKGE